jgi:hypothetical protein
LVKCGKYALHWHCFLEALALFSGDCSRERGDEIDRADGQENTGDGKQEVAGKIGTHQEGGAEGVKRASVNVRKVLLKRRAILSMLDALTY